jgi:FtsP/CotA-like multicopper oxidase with cupredoxin domain
MASLFDRRRFLNALGLGGAGLAAAACAQPAVRPLVAPISADNVRATAVAATGGAANGQHGGHATAGQAVGQTTAQVAGLSKADEMDSHHELGVKAFPAKTEGLGGQRLPYKLDGDVKVFELVCQKVQWEVEPGKRFEALAYNGVVPGPEIRVVEGDKVRVVVTNQLDQSTAIHFHGQRTPNKMDGVPFITQDPIKPGQSFTYEFVAKPAGSHMYHSHHNATEQVTKGLLGAFIVEPKDPAWRPKVDLDYTMILNDGPLGFTLNGKGFPATAPLTAKLGQKVLVRFMNEGLMIHPMHLHGMPMLVTHKDGYPLPQPYLCDTLNIAPGERYDAIIDADEPGVWAFHCHILSHAESPNGMFGMVTALIVEP